jgi:hypothetical protein
MSLLAKTIVFNPFVLLPVGLVFAALGLMFSVNIPPKLRELNDVRQLPPFVTANFGERAFLEGRISEQNQIVHGQFVAYVREDYRSSTARTSSWHEVARQTPPLIIETRGETVRIVNDHYALASTHVTLEEAAATLTKGAVQARGFVAGSPVLAVGLVDQETKGLVAKFLYAGTRSDYLAYLTKYLRNAVWLGSGSLVFAFVLFFQAGRQLRLFLLSSKGEQDPRLR